MSELGLAHRGTPPPGRVRVASEVVRAIVAYAALEVEGVAAMCDPAGLGLALHGQHRQRGVQVQMVGETGIRVDLHLNITPEASLTELADHLQTRVGEAVRSMLGLEAVEINLHVREIEGG
ncbi:MAG: Asp23/Gls24 family envelope stress response protein [Candidatus Dormibacteria bacterium]